MARAKLDRAAVYLRAAALATAFALGFLGLCSGVDLSERPLADEGLWAKAYYALSLFVIGGTDLGTPIGGPAWGRAILWAAYFFAPLITASALVETALRILNPAALRVRRLRGHVIVGGGGRLALLYVKRLRETEPHVPVVVVERDPAAPRLAELQGVYKVTIVLGDVRSDELLTAVAVERARRVMLLTGEDFANLDAAARIAARAPALHGHIAAHVSDLGFMHALPPGAATDYEIFNGLESAAVHLVKESLLARFESTAYRDLVILAGFGRFGQTVLDQLQTHASGSFSAVILVDLEAEAEARRFAERPGFGDYACHVIEGHVGDSLIWSAVDEVMAREIGDPVIVVGTGFEGTNLHVALDLIRRYPGAHITVRTFGQSPFTRQVAEATGLHPITLGRLIAGAMPQAWFES
nr:NAD-binding protein [Pseudenhygromyxa sp. WMMC2535]